MNIRHRANLLGHTGAIYALQVINNQLYSTGGDGNVVLWDLASASGKIIAKLTQSVYCMGHIDDQLILGSMQGDLHFIDYSQKKLLKSKSIHPKGVYAIANIDQQLVTGGADGFLVLWNHQSHLPIFSLKVSTMTIRCIIVIGENKFVAGSSDGAIYFCIIRHNAIYCYQSVVAAHSNSVFSIQFDANKRCIYSGSRDAQLKVWTTDGEPLHSIAAHLSTINAIAIHPNESIIASASRDKTIKIWNTDTYQLIKVLDPFRDNGHFNSVNHIVWFDEHLISGGDDKKIILWETA